MKIIVQDRQCLADIALQACGSLEAVFAIAEKNGLSVTDDLQAGQVLVYEMADVQNRQVVSTYKSDGVIPAGMVRLSLKEELETVIGEDTGLNEIQKVSDPVKSVVLTSIFTKQFNIQFA